MKTLPWRCHHTNVEKILLAEDDADTDEGADLDVDEDLNGLIDVVDYDGNTTSEPALLI